jgi:hypothetical protein
MPTNLPEDKETLKAMVRSLMLERDMETRRANDLQIEKLRLQVELERYKTRYCGPCADRLQSADELAQLLLNFAEELDPSRSTRAMFHRIPSRKRNCGE